MLNDKHKLKILMYCDDGESTKTITCDKVRICYNTNEITLLIRHKHDPFIWYEVETLELKKIIEIE